MLSGGGGPRSKINIRRLMVFHAISEKIQLKFFLCILIYYGILKITGLLKSQARGKPPLSPSISTDLAQILWHETTETSSQNLQ